MPLDEYIGYVPDVAALRSATILDYSYYPNHKLQLLFLSDPLSDLPSDRFCRISFVRLVGNIGSATFLPGHLASDSLLGIWLVGSLADSYPVPLV